MEDELLDVFDEHGGHLGVKPRAAVHRDGDWHLAFHLWVVSADGVLLQRRAANKASWPGFLDASAAGHLIAGEAIRDGLREADEELGAAYAFDDLESLGIHRVDEVEQSGLVNRELQHVFAIRDERPLDQWTEFDRVELDGLVLVTHDGFAALANAVRAGDDDVRAPGRAWDGTGVTEIEVSPGEVVPTPYLAEIAPVLRRVAGAQ
jgi:isopentenyldiphosphate isomerase